MPDNAVSSPKSPADFEHEIREIVKLHNSATGLGMKAVQQIGRVTGGFVASTGLVSADSLKAGLERLFSVMLEVSSHADSVKMVREAPVIANRIAAATSGAVGGAIGIAGVVPDILASTTVFFHTIRQVARRHGFNPDDEDIREECLTVFSSGGPGTNDDSAMESFLSNRVLINGNASSLLVQKVAEKFSQNLVGKLPAQAIPILGALTGALVNFVFIRYYEKMAEVHFRLLRLSETHTHEEIAAAFSAAVTRPARRRLGRT
jgi:hypothetical protein